MKETKTDTAANPPADLNRELEETKSQLAEAQKQIRDYGICPAELDAAVSAKMRMGLTREEAIACARRQLAHDRVLKEASAIKVEHADLHEAAKLTRRKQAAFIGKKLIEAGSL